MKRDGYRVGLRAAPELLHVRLYKGNRHAFWAMTKNILVGIHGRYWLAPAVIALPIFVLWTPLYCAFAGAAEGNVALTLASSGLRDSIWDALPGTPAVSLQSSQITPVPARCPAGRLLHDPPLLVPLRVSWRVAWRGRTVRVPQT